jgi:hypothetical protein
VRSSSDLVKGEIYEIINPHMVYRSIGHLGWFYRSESPRSESVLFLYIEQDRNYARFIVNGGVISLSRGYVRYLRPIKREKI